ncbi:unnamed protein product [Mytilus coruscus]|uniref:Phytanoyl-CoA hydroxylase-interacting protein-like C-terminal domain-containing protein n=1 Tax=Mytilus coruscus TaxID=42192 RepID=A0A6J8C586_MYTCO|nr:unnamed protein product [Mytilus coruscus]
MPKSHGIIFHGKIDDGDREIYFKVFGAERMNCLLLFLRPDIPSISGVTMIADGTVNKHDLPMSCVSGSGYYYCLDIYGLKKEKEMEEHYTVLACGGTRFFVAKIKNGKDANISIQLNKVKSLQFPLRNTTEVIFPIQFNHRPISRYTFQNKTTFTVEKRWIIFFKQSKDHEFCTFYILSKTDSYEEIEECSYFSLCDESVCFTKVEYETLYDKTIEFIKARKGKFRTIEYFYRNKSEKYFASITVDHNGIMKPYKKDHNGDPCSVINGRLDGLFFSTTVDFQTNQPFKYSNTLRLDHSDYILQPETSDRILIEERMCSAKPFTKPVLKDADVILLRVL